MDQNWLKWIGIDQDDLLNEIYLNAKPAPLNVLKHLVEDWGEKLQ